MRTHTHTPNRTRITLMGRRPTHTRIQTHRMAVEAIVYVCSSIFYAEHDKMPIIRVKRLQIDLRAASSSEQKITVNTL